MKELSREQTLLNDPAVRREIIVEHYTNATCRGLKGYNHSGEEKSASCIDDLTIELDIQDGIIKEACFDGVACAIATASADLLCSFLRNNSLKQARSILENYLLMINNKPHDKTVLGLLVVFSNVHQQLSRIKCAAMAPNIILRMVNNE